MKRSGRMKPYTEIGIKRLKCARCGRPATQQWSICADGNLNRPICTECDILMNQLVLEFVRDPDASNKIATYRHLMQGEDQMGAKNWEHCPKCLQRHQEYRDEEIRIAKSHYGIIGPDEYAETMAKAEAIPERPDGPSFRENYEIGIESDGTFTVSYGGHCTKCDYSHEFEHTEDVPI